MFDQQWSPDSGASVDDAGPGPDGSAVELLEQLHGTLKALAAVDLGACDPEDLAVLTVGLARAEAMVGAQSARAADAWKTSGFWASSGARTAKAWLVDRTGEGAPTCGRRLALGRAMRHLPEAGAAFEAGEISADHVRRLQAARNPRTAEVLARDEAWLVDQAKLLSYAEFDRVVTYWVQHADPDGAAQSAAEARAGRSAWLAETIGGMWVGEQTFDPLTGAIVAAELERLEKLLFDEDRAEARQRLGRHPHPDELSRTPAQRRADAWAEMAKRSAAMSPDAKQARILLSVLVGQGTFSELCEIELTRRPLPPEALADLLDAAVFETIIFDGPSRVLSVSDKRSFTGALRRGIQVRDRTCTGEACVVSALKCQIDHVNAHSDGGQTSEVNGQCCCDVHNGRKGTRSARRANRDPDRALRNLPNLHDPP